VRRSDSGLRDSCGAQTIVARSHDRQASHQAAVGCGRLDERGRRLFAAAEVRAAGWAGSPPSPRSLSSRARRSIAARTISTRRLCPRAR
jgi:hypothetical protein